MDDKLRKMRTIELILMAAIALVALAQSSKLKYPVAPTTDRVDDFHGVAISDPYRGLETADAPATQQWVEQENALTASYLAKLPGRDAFKTQLTQLWNYEKFSMWAKAGGRYFYGHNTGLQNQSVVNVADSLSGAARELLDPNTYQQDGTAALSDHSISWNGKLYAYAVSQAGSDWAEWHVRDIATGKDLPDVIRWTKFGFAWAGDDRGFYYSRYAEPPADQLLTIASLNQKIYFHKLGDPQSDDKLIYERPDHAAWGLYPEPSEEGRYLLIRISTGVPGVDLLSYRDEISASPRIVDLIATAAHSYDPIAIVGSRLYVRTNDAAPHGRVLSIDLEHPEREHWKEVVPEREETLGAAEMGGGKLLLSYMKDAHSALRLVTLENGKAADIPLPGIGTADLSPARLRDKEMFYTYSSFTAPPGIYRLDLETRKSTVVKQSKTAFDSAAFETKQVFYTSKDATRVPMFLSYRKGMKLDGRNPTLLYAYGGFDVALTPAFTPAIAEWMQLGGIYAEANLRGGSEYGEAWHKAGMREKKQNVFDDFIAAAEWLIANRYTSTPKLAVFGGSNGGLLVGAVLNQRPDLFGAAMPAVGVMDMLRFHKFGFGTQWVGEYGSPDIAEDFKVLRAYSPLHNIKRGVKYPPTLITTSDHDDRVMPGHSLKYAATLQQAQEGPAPILIRIETRAGHGAGKPTSKQIDEWADRLVFLRNALGMS